MQSKCNEVRFRAATGGWLDGFLSGATEQPYCENQGKMSFSPLIAAERYYSSVI